ncbi:hypothetical protein V2J09_012472 [Rumex salicifolius]
MSKPQATKRRANGIFSTMSVAHVDDDEEEEEGEKEEEVYQAEKKFSNGDFYTGQWAENHPQGHGKYLWSDGCMYVGEWKKGKITGKGKFSWPLGATYEGKFKNGYMDGRGTFTGSNGDTYRGSWVMNLMHGQGLKRYANGDFYEGEWINGFQEGHGRYQWRNGTNYIGQWKCGMISGNGTMIWANGNRFDGFWEDGFPRGSGTYRWSVGGFYVGVWSKDPMEQSGTYYPTTKNGLSSEDSNVDWSPETLYSVDLCGCIVCVDEKILIYPSQKMMSLPSFDGDLLQKQSIRKPSSNEVKLGRRSVDGRVRYNNTTWDDDNEGARIVLAKTLSDNIATLQVEESQTPLQIHPIKLPKEIKKQGVTISRGHKHYDLMLNLQLGIRHSVARPAPNTTFDLRASAFDPKEKVWTKFPPEGSKHTPPHVSCDFKWKDYCPVVFRTLRKLFKVDAADYMISVGDNLRELSSPGKSGSFFYLTQDDKYMIKTVKKAEVKVLLKMLPAYYNHVRSFENTLVTKFYGLHCVRLTGAAHKKVRFVIMGNLFCTENSIHRRFDLKGSSHGRTTDKPELEIDPSTTLKDLDLNYIFRLRKFWFQEFCRQVDRDCDFLEQERIMDYSLLVGLHFNESDRTVLDPTQWTSLRLGINMPAKAEVTVRRSVWEPQIIGEATGESYDVVLFFGIIDILQDYDLSKKLEHAYKSLQYDSTSISAVDPKQYSRRFRDFVFKVFAEDT